VKTTHHLKCWPEPFKAMVLGLKNFEYRKDDRYPERGGYQVGDVLVLKEFEPHPYPVMGRYTGRELTRTITYKLAGGQFGVPDGYCVLGLA
jgi:hypothetical protein